MANYDWLTKGGGKTVNPLNDPYFGTQSASQGGGGFRGEGSGGMSLGNGNGTGYMNWGGVAGNEAFYTDAMNPGADNETPASVDPKALDTWLKSNNYKLKDSGGNGGKGYRWIEDAAGNVVGEPTEYTNKDSAFQAAVLAAAAVVTGGVAAAGGTLTTAPGAAAAEAGGSGLLSGMDLAADAALGSGNNITTAAGMLGGDTAALGGGDLLADEIASEAASGAGDAVTGATGGTSAPGYSAASNYGAGMTGAQTGMFDSVLAATGSTTLASGASSLAGAASSAWDWLGSSSVVSAGGKLFGNTLATDILKLVGAGVMQASAENATEDQRKWIEEQQAARRRRQKPAKTPGMFTTATRGTNG